MTATIATTPVAEPEAAAALPVPVTSVLRFELVKTRP